MTTRKPDAPWNPLDQPVDKVKLGGRLSPGLAEITGASSPRKWDEQSGPGLSGAILLFRGISPSHFTIRLHLYTVQDWVDWDAFRPLVAKPVIGKYPRALDIVHPIVNDLGIHSCVVDDLKQPEPGDAGEWTIEITCIEYRELHAAQGKPEGSEATPSDPRDDLIGKLAAQAAAEWAAGDAP